MKRRVRMKAKSTTKRKNKNAPNAESVDDCYLRVRAMLEFRLTVTAMRNISVSPSHDGPKPVVELCGTVNFDPTRTFAEETARLVSCVKDGSHKLVNSIKVVPMVNPWPVFGPEDVTCCCPESGCAVMTACPGC
jgi:hypothetical protein